MLNKIDLFNGSVSIHDQNIRQPAIEMFKTLKGVITEFLKGIFKLQTNCQKSNKVIGTCILSLKNKETIYSYDRVALIRFSLFTSITIFSNKNIFYPFLTFLYIFRFECSIGLNPTNPIKPIISEWLFRCAWYFMNSVKSYL